MPTVDLFKIQKLYQEKRYSEAIFEIELTTTDKNREQINVPKNNRKIPNFFFRESIAL